MNSTVPSLWEPQVGDVLTNNFYFMTHIAKYLLRKPIHARFTGGAISTSVSTETIYKARTLECVENKVLYPAKFSDLRFHDMVPSLGRYITACEVDDPANPHTREVTVFVTFWFDSEGEIYDVHVRKHVASLVTYEV